MSYITNHLENVNQNYNVTSTYSIRIAPTKKKTENIISEELEKAYQTSGGNVR